MYAGDFISGILIGDDKLTIFKMDSSYLFIYLDLIQFFWRMKFYLWKAIMAMKGYHGPPAGGPKVPPDGSEVSFYQTMQSIR